MPATLTINGVGVAASVEVEDGETYAEALSRAGFADTADLDVSVDGAPLANPESTPVPGGVQVTVTATPK